MASPQTENGFTKLANELLDAFCAVSLSGHEWNVIHAIIRKTYGYNKKEDWVTNTQIMKLTGQTQQKVSQAKRKLIEKRIITENGNKISLNKNYEEWLELPKTVTRVTENGNKQLPKTVNTKEKKDNITKTTSEQSSGNDKKDMWNRKYSDDFKEGIVDYDGDGSLKDEQAEAKAKDKQDRDNIKHNLRLVEEPRGLAYNPASLNADVKVYQQLLKYGWSHEGIIKEYLETIDDPYWKNERKLGKFPTLKTVEFRLRNKQPS